MAIKQKVILLVALIIGVVIQVLPVIRSGLNYSYGIGYWGPNGHDTVWHLSLINHIANPLSIDMPVFAGEKLKNYHPFFDILINFSSQLTHIYSSIWLFQIFPIISALVLLYLSFVFGQMVTGSFTGGIILLALNTLANSFGWLVTLVKYGNFSGESIFWAMQSPSNQLNPPYNLSLIFILILFIILYRRSKLNLWQSFTIFIILTLLPITKAYSAIVGFSFFGLYALKSRSLKNFALFFISLISAVLLFVQYNPQSSGILTYHPFWFINSMIESPDRIFIPYLANMRYTLEASGRIGPRYILLILFTLSIFIIGNFGWRLLGIIKTNFKNFFNLTLLFNIILLTLIPTLFIQKATSWNTIQFLYYALFLSNIFLAVYLKNHRTLAVIVFITYILSLIGSLPNYLGKIPPAALSVPEQSSLKFLSAQPAGTVLTVPYDPYLKQNFTSTPIPLYAYETTAYVSAYSHHLVYLEDEMNSENSGYNVSARRQSENNFFAQKNINEDRGFLVNNQIDYIYLAGLQKKLFPLNVSHLYLEKIYENSDSLIYRVQR
jgi:hypothetical protein